MLQKCFSLGRSTKTFVQRYRFTCNLGLMHVADETETDVVADWSTSQVRGGVRLEMSKFGVGQQLIGRFEGDDVIRITICR